MGDIEGEMRKRPPPRIVPGVTDGAPFACFTSTMRKGTVPRFGRSAAAAFIGRKAREGNLLFL